MQNFELIYLGLSIFRQSSNLNHTLWNYLVQNYTDNIFLLCVVSLTVKDSTTSGLIIAFILERFWADVLWMA